VIVARTALWIMLATLSVAALVWLSRTSWAELDRHRRRLRDAPDALRESSDLAFAAGVGVGAAIAALVLGGAVMVAGL
jgi:heme A synthase